MQQVGADRRRLFTALWPEFGERCLVARDGGRLVGYLIARDPILGPWAAEDASVAEHLLAAALANLPGATPDYRPLVMVPRSNDLCAQLLAKHGFVEQRRLRHMRRGGVSSPGIPERLFGQSSFAHG